MSNSPVDEEIRVLLVEDDEDDYHLLREVLREVEPHRYAVTWAPDLERGLEALSTAGFDVVLSDFRLGARTGLDLMREMAEASLSAPVIVLTGHGDRTIDLQAMEAGAADYLIKGEIDAPLLERAIRYAIRQHQLLERLREASVTDDLTGLHNRRGFLALLEPQLKLARRRERSLVLLFLDLDGMKTINDTLGHEEGDRALVDVARLLRETFRDTDVVGRLGGDEFVVLAIDTPPDESAILVERLEEAMTRLNQAPERRYELSLSVGVEVYDPCDPCSVEEFLHRADAAMYAQKRTKPGSRSGGDWGLGASVGAA